MVEYMLAHGGWIKSAQAFLLFWFVELIIEVTNSVCVCVGGGGDLGGVFHSTDGLML
jgi:hypothetical protein